jgi:hypothetical protein
MLMFKDLHARRPHRHESTFTGPLCEIRNKKRLQSRQMTCLRFRWAGRGHLRNGRSISMNLEHNRGALRVSEH